MDEIVLLTSYTNEAAKAFKAIEDKGLEESEFLKPQMTKINEKVKVVSATEALLQPDHGENLVSMHYVFKTAKKIKVWLVIGHADITANAAKNIKETLLRLLSMFAPDKGIGKDLSASCGIIITNPDPTMTVQVYINNLNRLHKDQKFLNNA